MERLRGWLSFPRATAIALSLGFAVGAPSLWMGRFADDYLHLAVMRGVSPFAGPFDLYHFGDGDPSHIGMFVRHGPYPWWTLPEIRLWFWRPLSSALASFEELVLHAPVALQHLHSIAWYLALIAVAASLFKRHLPGFVGALALIIFAFDEAHFIPLAWLANRNALVAAMPAFLALLLHLRWREDGVRWAMPLSVLAWATALTGGETAIGVMAYVGAYELFSSKGTWARRALALAPLAAVFLGYIALYRLGGYGAYGSGIYLDPGQQPLRYLGELAPRWLALSGAALLKIPSELGTTSMPVKWLAFGGGAFALGFFFVLARRFWPSIDAEEKRHLKWLVIGAVLSMLPLASTFPSNRLLLVPSFGASVLVAAVVRYSGRLASTGLGLLHVIGPLPGWVLQYWVGMAAIAFGEDAVARAEIDDAKVHSQRVVLLAAPDPLIGAYVGLMRQMNGAPEARAWFALTFDPVDQTLKRLGPSSISLEVNEGRFLGSMFEQLFRGADHKVKQGDVFHMDGMDVVVDAADALGPSRFVFTFDAPLEDPSLLLLIWKNGALRRYTPPPVGGIDALHIEVTVPLLR